MRTHAHTIVQLCASTWVWSLAVWAAPVDQLHAEHRGTVEIPLPGEGPLGPSLNIPEGGSFMVSGLDGSYRFGLQSEDQWRMESRNTDGVVEGRYVYQNPEGQVVDISYNAGPQGFIAEGDAIPGGRAPLVDAPIDDEATRYIQATAEAAEEVKGVPYVALPVGDDFGLQAVVVRADNNLDDGIPFGALALSGLPGFEPVFPGDNSIGDREPYGAIAAIRSDYDVHIIEDLENEAIVVPSIWPPKLTFDPVKGFRGDIFNDNVYGPPLLDGEELKSGVTEY